MQFKVRIASKFLLIRNIFICLAAFSCLHLQAADTYFYKNKFPGLTCVPLSFYISTYFGSNEYKSFWDSVQGGNLEKKFEGFLNASNYFRIIDSETAEDDVRAASMFYKILHGTDVERDHVKIAPVESTVIGRGMSIRGLYELLNNLNSDLLSKLNLKLWDYRYLSDFDKLANPKNDEVLSLESLKEKLTHSINNGVPPVIGITKKVWGSPNVFTTNPFDFEWIPQYSHALTLVHVDSEIDPEKNSFEVEYIENEDGQRKKAYFYVYDKKSPVQLPHDYTKPLQTIYFRGQDNKSKKLYFYELIELMMSDSQI